MTVMPRAGRSCEVCLATYRATYQDQRTCSRACGWALRQRSNPPKSPEPERRCPTCGKVMLRGSGATYCRPECRPTFYVSVRGSAERRTCVQCGEGYEYRRRQGRSRGMCKPCDDNAAQEARRQDKRRRQRRKRAAASDRVPDQYIYQRDGWRCGICRKRIRRNVATPHPLAPTIDHVVPLSQGGDDTAANKRAAHFLCNSVRGNRGGGEQLALVG